MCLSQTVNNAIRTTNYTGEMVAVFNTNTITFVPLIVAFKVMSISNELVMTDFAIDHANNGVNDDDIVSMIYSIVVLHCSNVGVFYSTII